MRRLWSNELTRVVMRRYFPNVRPLQMQRLVHLLILTRLCIPVVPVVFR